MTDLDFQVLRAVARLSRTRRSVDCESIALRAGGSLEDVRASLGRLSRASLVERGERAERAEAPRLTMAGLAVAVASGGSVIRKRRAPAATRRAA